MKVAAKSLRTETAILALCLACTLGIVRTLCVDARTASGHTAILSLIISCGTTVALAIACSLIRCSLFLTLFQF